MHRTPLAQLHEAAGGRMTEFAGWWMPVHYGSIVEEHRAVREGVGLFDVSHMGRLLVKGRDAVGWLNGLITNDCTKIPDGRARYSLLTNEHGGCLDDLLVHRDGDRLFVVCNAGRRARVWAWLEEHRPGAAVQLEDATERLAMIAVQGPRAVALLAPHAEAELAALPYYGFAHARFLDCAGTVARTGYTGEDGFELYVEAERAAGLWERLRALDAAVRPCGLGARDTLRLEAGMPLYGHELDEHTTPLEAGLDFAVKLGKAGGFIGGDALRAQREAGLTRKLVGVVVHSRRIPRAHHELLAGDARVGEITSGTASPTLGANIGMAYVGVAHAAPGTALDVVISGARHPAVVVPLPFYRRPGKDGR